MAKEESKHERFIRVAEARTNKIIDMLQLLGNCSNRSTYEYSKEETRKIFAAIELELRNAKSKFEASGDNKKQSFSLHD